MKNVFTRTSRFGLIRSAFTLIEMLVVILIMMVLLLIAIPAFTSIMQTADETTAITRFGAGITAARDAALSNTGDADTAAVFVYEPGGRTTVVVCEKIGTLEQDVNNANQSVTREVFVPAEGIEALQLPEGWMVRAYTPTGTVDADWYEPSATGGGSDRYPTTEGSWIFPETGFFDHTLQGGGADRQTFMVRFQAGTGMRKTAGGPPVLVVLQRPSPEGRTGVIDSRRIDRVESVRRWALRVLSLSDPVERRDLIGDRSGDTALVRAVSQLALYQEAKLAAGLGNPAIGGYAQPVRIDDNTGCLYAVDPAAAQAGRSFTPRYVAPLNGDNRAAMRISRWIEGYAQINLAASEVTAATPRAQTAPARVFVIPRHAGGPLQISIPTATVTGGAP